jgi:hypothetical protein
MQRDQGKYQEDRQIEETTNQIYKEMWSYWGRLESDGEWTGKNETRC